MSVTQRKHGWKLRVGGETVRIAGDPPVQVEALTGWQTNVLEVTPFDEPGITPGTGVLLRFRDFGADEAWTQFSGEIDRVAATDEPHSVSLRCVGPMIRLKRVRTGAALDLSGMTDGEAVKAILDACDVPYVAGDIADAGYVLGDRVPVLWEPGTSGMDMIARLDDVFGMATREQPNGKVIRYRYELAPRAAQIRRTYEAGVSAKVYGITRNRGGADGIQNAWEVRGAEYVETSLYEECTLVPYASAARRNDRLGGSAGVSTYQDDIIQDADLAAAVCKRLMRWFNREPDEITVEAENDPDVMPGAVIGVIDSAWGVDLPVEKPYTVMTVDRAGSTMTLGCVGGASGDVGAIEQGYEQTCNETVTEVPEEDLPPDTGYEDPDPDTYDAGPPETPPEPVLADVPSNDALGDCGDPYAPGAATWFRLSAGTWGCVGSGGSCAEIALQTASATLWANAADPLDSDQDAYAPAPLKVQVSGEFWFSTAAGGDPQLGIGLEDWDGYGGAGDRARVTINSTLAYGVSLQTEESAITSPGGYATHPGCVAGVVANNGSANFYQRVPSRGVWHPFTVTFDETASPARVVVTIDGYTEYVSDERCTPVTSSCGTAHPNGHRLYLAGVENVRTTNLTTDPPVKVRNLSVYGMAWDGGGVELPETCAPNPGYTPSPGVEGCAPELALCDCAVDTLAGDYLRDATVGGGGWSQDGTVFSATSADAVATVNLNGVQTSANDLDIGAPAVAVIEGEFRFGTAAAGNNASFVVRAEPTGATALTRRGPSARFYAADHTNVATYGFGAVLDTETSETGQSTAELTHPLCPWSATGQANGRWNLKGAGAALDTWHTFRVEFDEATQPQRTTVTLDSSTEYVEDVWYEPGSCTAASGHPGTVCAHDGHRLQVEFFATGGTYGTITAEGTLGATDYFTGTSGGNVGGTSEEKTFNGPYGLAELSDGRIVVTNVLSLCVAVFDPANQYYRDWSATWTIGTATYPFGVAVIDDEIYVALQDGKIRKYDASGTFLTTLTGQTSGRRLAAGPDGYLYLAQADTLNRVRVIDPVGNTVVRTIGSSGTGNGQFGTAGPGGIAFDADGQVYVADTTGQRINVYSSTGTYVTHWGTAGSGAGQFDSPRGIAIRGETVFVVNLNTTTNQLSKVQMFGLDGTYKQEWVGSTNPVSPPTSTSKFDYPTSVWVSGDLVYVTDGYGGIGETGRNEVRVLTSTAPVPDAPLGQVRNLKVGYVDGTNTCTRNPEYVAGETGGVSPWA